MAKVRGIPRCHGNAIRVPIQCYQKRMKKPASAGATTETGIDETERSRE
jgi:hypothetical protein